MCEVTPYMVSTINSADTSKRLEASVFSKLLYIVGQGERKHKLREWRKIRGNTGIPEIQTFVSPKSQLHQVTSSRMGGGAVYDVELDGGGY
ncbi:uncharacterized protein [Dysidea avara]|uniref:uncharacterized protein n=1 Tax=Dysidea avara TaxID=196820 RepID=UPI003316DEF9